MNAKRQRWSWVVDALLFVGFLIAMWLDVTGLAVHQWWGVAVAGLAIYHLWAHRHWVATVTERIMDGRTNRTAARSWAVDAGLAVGFGAITVTGVVMSTWLGLELAGYAAWRTAHVILSVATLALVVVKIALHWRWIVSVAQRYVFTARMLGAVGSGAELQPAVVVVGNQVGRREFLGMMTAVGAFSLLAGVQALADDDSSVAGLEIATDTGSTRASNTSNSASSTCTVACSRHCSYPGHCRRYTDSNNNGLCDMGECVSGSSSSGAATGVEPGTLGPGEVGTRPGRGSRG